MKTNPFTNVLVAAVVTRRSRKPIHQPPPHIGGYAITLLAAAALLTHTTFAAGGPKPPPPPTSGTIVLDYWSGGNGSENFGMAVGSSGAVYSSGSLYAPDHGIVFASADSGGNWITVLDDAPPGFNVGFSGGIAS